MASGFVLETGVRTVVAADNDVSNGFVKNGKQLPYVFETTDSGLRKRSSKILPVCGVCGKKFVCVTTMKRHLVTHTGEKPFACKVCGKQYTQKGNLRVHERTHRNDRPFECDICHQKFYRKEPMQKHQWRQHAIAHSKTKLPPVQPPEPIAPISIEANFAHKPAVPLKHKKQMVEAYLKEQEEKDLTLHTLSLDIEPNSLECGGCGCAFTHKSALRDHQSCQDEPERPFKCCCCGYKFRQRAHLQKHQLRIHGSERMTILLPKEPGPIPILPELQEPLDLSPIKSSRKLEEEEGPSQAWKKPKFGSPAWIGYGQSEDRSKFLSRGSEGNNGRTV